MKPTVTDGEVWYGDVPMPNCEGVAGLTQRLVATWHVSGVLPDGRAFELCVARGMVFDGCSIPRGLWWLCGSPHEVPRVAAALAHDWLYWSHVCDRATADAIFRALMRAVGESVLRTTVEYLALRVAGRAAWRSHGENDQAFARVRGYLLIDGERQGEEE